MDEKERLSHGMSSEKASRIKLRGHNKEFLFADLIGGEVRKGTNKIDVVDSKGRTYTIKGGSEVKGKEGREGRWQLFMFSKSKFLKEENFPAREFMLEILNIFPKDRDEYLKNEEPVKEKVGQCMVDLKNYWANKDEVYRFFDKSIFNFNIDYLVIYHDDIFHIFERTEILNILKENLIPRTSKGNQKVVFDFNGKLAIELEVRKSIGKYPSMLLSSNKSKILDILIENINSKENFSRSLVLYGNSIDMFKETIE